MGLFDDEDSELKNKTDIELQNILDSPILSKETSKSVKEIQRMRSQIEQAGMDPEMATPRESMFWTVLDMLDTPRQAVAGIANTALRGDLFQDGVGLGALRGIEEGTTTSDILREHDIIDNPIARGVVGFAGDVLTDPLTWISGGSNQAIKAGGKALSAAGKVEHANVLKRLVDETGDLVQASDKADSIFKALNQYEDLSKQLSSLAKTKYSDDSVELIVDQLSKAKETIGDYVQLSDDPLKDLVAQMYTTGQGGPFVDKIAQNYPLESLLKSGPGISESLFEKPAITIGMDIPFAGHFKKEAEVAETVLDSPGPIGQALRGLGAVVKPGRVDLARFEASDELIQAAEKIDLWTKDKLAEVGEAIVRAEQIPVAGNIVKAGRVIAKKTSDTLKFLNDGMKNIFNQKAIWGADAHNNRLDFLSHKAAAKDLALNRAINSLGDDILQNEPLQKEIMLAIDSQAMETMKALQPSDDVLKVLNQIENTGHTNEAQKQLIHDYIKNSGAEEQFAQRLANLQKQVPPEMADGITRVGKLLDQVHAEEVFDGIDASFLSAYIPHRYSNLNKIGNAFKPRKYATFTDAFETKGYLPDYFLPGVLAKRVESSLIKRAEKNFFNRLVIENGLPPEVVTRLYREAQLNPGGSAEKLLAKNRIDVTPLDKKAMIEGNINKATQQYYAKLGINNIDSSQALNTLADTKAKIHNQLWESGLPPKDLTLPMPDLNEIGEVVKYKGNDVFLPKPIARAYKETAASKDLVKSILGDSKVGHIFLNAIDATQGMFKRLVTLPFPAYYGQNLLGNVYRDLLKGSTANSPAMFARAYSTLAGKSVITSKNGLKMDKKGLENVIKQFGINYSVNDYLNHVDSFGKSDVSRYLATKNKLTDNLKNMKLGAALEQAHQKAINTFEGFFKINTFLHRFEQGDGIADAVRYTNDLYFNYRDMSPVESSIFRRFYMFYGYMSQATKSMMTDLITNPGRIQTQVHGANALMEFFSDPKAAPSFEEADSKLLRSTVGAEELSRVIGRTEEGKPIVGRGFASPVNAVLKQFSLQMPRNFSINEIIGAAKDSTTRTLQKQFASSNPFINSIAQQVSGKNLYFDKPLSAAFMRKLPSLNAIAEQVAGYKHNELPIDLDAATKKFLNAVPDSTGNYLIGDPNKMWILTNMVPFLGRAISMANTAVNPDLELGAKTARLGLGVNIDDSDIERSRLFTMKKELGKFIDENSIKQILKNQDLEED